MLSAGELDAWVRYQQGVDELRHQQAAAREAQGAAAAIMRTRIANREQELLRELLRTPYSAPTAVRFNGCDCGVGTDSFFGGPVKAPRDVLDILLSGVSSKRQRNQHQEQLLEHRTQTHMWDRRGGATEPSEMSRHSPQASRAHAACHPRHHQNHKRRSLDKCPTLKPCAVRQQNVGVSSAQLSPSDALNTLQQAAVWHGRPWPHGHGLTTGALHEHHGGHPSTKTNQVCA
jgi:hypothetical protein